jgi:hypothetical protein
MQKIWIILAPLLVALQPVLAEQPAAISTNNAEMSSIYAADQAPRTGGGVAVDWAVVGPQDLERRRRTRELLDAGALRTADDFYHAATVFQHGTNAADYMLAHTLAVIAAARGRSDATWMAAATLDRYLQAVGHSQIYGTQYSTRDRQNTTQEPYDRALIPDALRGALGVPTQAEQEVRRREIEARYRNSAR